MESRKSFEGIHDDYAFFLAHTTEPQRCREAMLMAIQKQKSIRRWLDFGCGGGEFLNGLLENWSGEPSHLELSLVDVDMGYLELASALVRDKVRSVHATTKLEAASTGFDLITSNHVLYYVGDIERALNDLLQKLGPGGQANLILGGQDNQLVRLWIEAYSAADVPLPYLHAGHVESALLALSIEYGHSEILSELRFPDTRQNRLKILRFLFNEWVGTLGEDTLLALMDRYVHDSDIVMKNTDTLFTLSGPS